MSQSERDLDRQVKRHKGPLLGYLAIFIFAAIISLWWLGREFGQSEGPRGAEMQIDGRTGESVDGPAPAPVNEKAPQPTTNSMD
ncbi:MAG: hypothetical protein P1U72_06170 [Paracoccaceae bacterium]|nr:hypothetical protein [Paracoccaceae bacterium]